ncbi:Rgp1-domain-containing protein [Suillus weaverae]|nr:Rgp1-domain-containing protein [Suillus weaverae]
MDSDPSIKVNVSPSQSAYFAGEPFTVAITFTNTRTPSAPVQKSHKRNAYSVSSAPLARPPTSPGLSPRPPDFVRALGIGIGEEGRKGLIGKGKGKEVLEARRSALEQQADPVTPRTTCSIPQNHPHARKQSVFASASSLDTIAETPAHSYPPRKQPHQSLGLGHPPIPHSTTTEPLPPNTTLLLYSYAQLSGTAHILPTAALSNIRAQLLKKPVLGGGSMDIARTRRSHSRSASLTASLFSLLPSAERSSLTSQSDASSANVGAANVVEEGEEEMPLPVFEAQPAMLAVDLALNPGESRTYTYTLPLPSTLPPTFTGRMIRFSYELVVGTCRRGDGGEGTASSVGVTVSRVMKIPIRVYNWVSVSTPQRPYDLLLPVRKHDSGVVLDLGSAGADAKKDLSSASSNLSPTTSPCDSLDDLRAYGERLLETFPAEGSTGVRIKEPVESVPENVPSSSGLASGSSDPLRAFEGEREGELTGCREAVEILTRNPKKVSYDVTKDNVKVAVLTFTKSAYRLGETVLGVVEINERGGRGKVISLSATLETSETLPASLGTTNTSATRRVHAEHHASFTGSTLRTTFALDIPSDACPGFGIVLSSPTLLGNGHISGSGNSTGIGAVAGPGKAGGLTWKVHLTLLVGVTAPNARVRGLTRDGAPTAWGSAWRAPVGIAPEQQVVPGSVAKEQVPQSWTSYLMTSFLGTGEKEYHDGDDIDDEGEEEGDWKDVQVEIVECEVPVVVWPGNTAFSAVDVVFDV